MEDSKRIQNYMSIFNVSREDAVKALGIDTETGLENKNLNTSGTNTNTDIPKIKSTLGGGNIPLPKVNKLNITLPTDAISVKPQSNSNSNRNPLETYTYAQMADKFGDLGFTESEQNRRLNSAERDLMPQNYIEALRQYENKFGKPYNSSNANFIEEAEYQRILKDTQKLDPDRIHTAASTSAETLHDAAVSIFGKRAADMYKSGEPISSVEEFRAYTYDPLFRYRNQDIQDVYNWFKDAATGGFNGLVEVPSFEDFEKEVNRIASSKYESTASQLGMDTRSDVQKEKDLLERREFKQSLQDQGRFSSIEEIKNYSKEYIGWYKDLYDDNGNLKSNIKNIPLGNEYTYWQDLLVKYNTIIETGHSHEEALGYISDSLQDFVSQNQSFLDALGRKAISLGNTVVGTVSVAAGLPVGAVKELGKLGWAAVSPDEYNQDFIDQVYDNAVTRFGSNVMNYGLTNTVTGEAEKMKEQGYQYTDMDVAYNLEHDISLNSLLGNIVDATSFTAGIATGTGLAKMGSAALQKVAKKAIQNQIKNNLLKNTIKGAGKFAKGAAVTLEKTTPYALASTEGTLAYIDNKDAAYNYGMKEALQAFNKKCAEYHTDQYATDPEYKRMIDEQYMQYYLELLSNGMSQEKASDLASEKTADYGIKFQKHLHAADLENMEKSVEEHSMQSGKFAAAMHAIIDGPLLLLGQRRLFDPTWDKHLKFKQKFKYSNNKGKINVESNKMSTSRKAWEYLKEPGSEFLQEQLATTVDETAKDFGEYNIKSYLKGYMYNGDAISNAGKIADGAWSNALQSFGEHVTSKESFISGIYGLAGSMLGTFSLNMNNYYGVKKNSDGKYTQGFIFGKQKGESWGEYISRVTPWSSPIFVTQDRINRMEETMRKNTERLQTIVDNSDDKFISASRIAAWEDELQKSIDNNDEWGHRNTTLGAMIQTAIAVDKLKDSDMKEGMLKHLELVSNLSNASQEEQQKYIESVRQEKGIYSDMSDSEIIEMAESNAKNMLKTYNQIVEESKKIDKDLPEIDLDTKEAILFSKIRAMQAKEAVDKNKKDLKDIKIDNSVENSNLSEEEKKASLKYGDTNIENELNTIKKEIQDKKIELETAKQKYKKLKDKKAKEKQREKIQEIKNEIAELNADKKSVEKDLHLSDAIDGKVLSESEIMELSDVEKGKLFSIYKNINNIKKRLKDPKILEREKQYLKEILNTLESSISKKQLEVLDNLITKAQVQDSKFVQKIIENGEYQKMIDAYAEDYSKIAKDNEYLSKYLQNAKKAAMYDIAKNEYNNILDIDNIEEYENALNQLAKKDRTLYSIVLNRLKELSSKKSSDPKINKALELWNKYESVNKEYSNLATNIQGRIEKNELSVVEALNMLGTFRYLKLKGVDIEDETAVAKELFDSNGMVKKEYEDYLNSVFENDNNFKLLNAGESYHLLSENYKKVKQNDIDNNIAKGKTSNPSVKITIEDAVDADKDEDTTIEEYDSEQSQDNSTNDNTLNSNTDDTNVYDTTEENLKSEESESESIEEKNKKDSENTSEKDNEIKKANTQTTLNSKKLESARIPKEILESDDTIWGRFYKKYKITEYIKKHELELTSGKKDIFFITDETVNSEISQSMENYNSNSDKSIIAVVQDDNGLLDINGVKYQPIAIMPSSSANTEGISNVANIRTLSEKDGYNSTRVIVDASGNPIRGKISGDIQVLLPQKAKDPVSVKKALSTSTEGVPNTKTPNKESFFARLHRKAFGDRTGLVYRSEDGKYDMEVFIVPVEKSKHKNTGKTIEESFNISTEGKNYNDIIDEMKESLKYNFLVLQSSREVAKVIKNLLTNFESSSNDNADTKDKLEKINKNLNATMSSSGLYLNLPEGYSWKVVRDYDKNKKEFIPGQFKITLVHNNIDTVFAIPINANGINPEEVDDKIIELTYAVMQQLFTKDGKVRIEGRDRTQHYDAGSFVRFNMDILKMTKEGFHVVKNDPDKKLEYDLYQNIASALYEDDLLFTMYPTLETGPYKVSIELEKNNSDIVEVTEKNNADFAVGVSEESKEELPIDDNSKETKKVVDTMIENSKKWENPGNTKFYTAKSKDAKGNEERRMRVTSAIQADPDVDKIDPNNPYITPSTSYGTSVDKTVRTIVSLFNATDDKQREILMDELQNISNLSDADKHNIYNSVYLILDNLKTQGYTVVSDTIVATGNLTVKDQSDNNHTLKIAGTIDLLAYNEKTGEYIIIDIKTKRGGQFQGKIMEKYAKQLYLYKKFLEEEYGISISDTYVMGFGIGYSKPNKGVVDYTVNDSGVLQIQTPDTSTPVDAFPSALALEFGNGISGLHKVNTSGVYINYSDLDANSIVEEIESYSSEEKLPMQGGISEISLESENKNETIEVQKNNKGNRKSEYSEEELEKSIGYVENKAPQSAISIVESLRGNENLKYYYEELQKSEYYNKLSDVEKQMIDNIVNNKITNKEKLWIRSIFKPGNKNAALAVAYMTKKLSESTQSKTSQSKYLETIEKKCE